VNFCTGIFSIKYGIAVFDRYRFFFFTRAGSYNVPRCGFSFAVSGIIIPPFVVSPVGAGFTMILS